ncbi:MAG TPA: acyl-ACP--UDP-N-acetylglucosamine O-acyltransferase [Chthoniobacterales bacterium]|jgi:UDP-N-acetylglucosamine acyltransferase
MSNVHVHATAVVNPDATIGSGVEIGPYCVVGSDVVIGPDTKVQTHVVLEGTVRLGARNVIGHGAVIGGPPQDLAFDPTRKTGVEIGDDNVIREYCTIHRGTAEGTVTRIGNKNFLMAGTHLGHNCTIGNNVIIANNCLLAGYVTVDDGAFLGGGSTFHQFTRLGRLVMVQGMSGLGKDLPPFVLAAEKNCVYGLNVIGLRRAGISASDRDQIKAAFRLIYTSGMNLSQALEKGASMDLGPFGREFLDFVASAKKRGLCPYRKGAEADSGV